MSSYGFLQKYIRENNYELPIEDLLNDEDFLDELKFKDEKMLK
jgi:hypothetical protein